MKSILKWVLCLIIILGLIPVINAIDPAVIPIVKFDAVINKILKPFEDEAWGSSIRRRRVMQMQRRIRVLADSTYCSSGCNPGDPTDQFCEDFEGANTITNDGSIAVCTGWTATEDAAVTIDGAAHSGSLACTKKGSVALNIDGLTVGNENGFIEKELASSQGTVYVHFYFNLVTSTMDSNNSDQVGVLRLEDAADEDPLSLRAEKDAAGSDKYHLEMQYDESDVQSRTYDGSEVLTMGTWYRMACLYIGNSTAECSVDTDNDGSWDETISNTGAVEDRTVDDILIGPHISETNLTDAGDTDLQYDLIGVDNDAMLSECAT
jgi:hypothetical protein